MSVRRDSGRSAPADARGAALGVLCQVLGEGRSLSACLPPALAALAAGERPLVQTLCYGTLRWYPQLQRLVRKLLSRPLHGDGPALEALLALGCYQLLYTRIAAHAAIHETVALARRTSLARASGLVNAVLRRLQRELPEWRSRLTTEPWSHAHPDWLLQRLAADWPSQWRQLVTANNGRAPMTLRVNAARITRAAYLEKLAEADMQAHAHPYADTAVVCEVPCEVERLPGFHQGEVSVQDAAAQLAAPLLDAQPGERVLDACAAPGGKTGHILERTPGIGALVALDIDSARLGRVDDNLVRLGLAATLVTGDATTPGGWWDGQPFDRILLDAPCSACGVIRRHPDIKVLRKASDIAALAARQRAMLESLWALLRSGGRLLYVTCSVLREENEAVVGAFLQAHADARERPVDVAWGQQCPHGRQVLAGEADCDGLYYAVLERAGEGGAS